MMTMALATGSGGAVGSEEAGLDDDDALEGLVGAAESIFAPVVAHAPRTRLLLLAPSEVPCKLLHRGLVEFVDELDPLQHLPEHDVVLVQLRAGIRSDREFKLTPPPLCRHPPLPIVGQRVAVLGRWRLAEQKLALETPEVDALVLQDPPHLALLEVDGSVCCSLALLERCLLLEQLPRGCPLDLDVLAWSHEGACKELLVRCNGLGCVVTKEPNHNSALHCSLLVEIRVSPRGPFRSCIHSLNSDVHVDFLRHDCICFRRVCLG
mmetsp:Transcript_52004/g.123015  ORF Transcript_52004/g.123015 Transcript_52004/m.123015 type:complete len:265 (-) Transcript_52004:273-1067(-)